MMRTRIRVRLRPVARAHLKYIWNSPRPAFGAVRERIRTVRSVPGTTPRTAAELFSQATRTTPGGSATRTSYGLGHNVSARTPEYETSAPGETKQLARFCSLYRKAALHEIKYRLGPSPGQQDSTREAIRYACPFALRAERSQQSIRTDARPNCQSQRSKTLKRSLKPPELARSCGGAFIRDRAPLDRTTDKRRASGSRYPRDARLRTSALSSDAPIGRALPRFPVMAQRDGRSGAGSGAYAGSCRAQSCPRSVLRR